MPKLTFYNERNVPIGLAEKYRDTIHYYTYSHGKVGYYNVRTKQYTRLKKYSGKRRVPFAGHDYGEQDVYYWAEH